MPELLKGVFLQKAFVDFLLLFGTSQLCRYPAKILRIFIAAILGGIYTSACLLIGFYFLGNFLWRCVSLMVMSLVAYGLQKSTLRQFVIFALLNLAMGGAIELLGNDGIKGILCAIVVLILLYFSGKTAVKRTVPVELNYGDKHLSLTALHDTGNTLRDPITGRGVLVVGADIATKLTGLTQAQLQKPIESLGILPGLRLVPYRSIDNSNGFLLALPLRKVKVGTWQGSALVAFAPNGIGTDGAYQALTGGTL